VILLGTAWLRYHLLGVALERDEGEYAYGGQLLLQGIAPYTLLYSMKLPGIYAVYAGIMALFGQSAVGVHLGLLWANLAAITLLFFVGREVGGRSAGLGAALSFAVFSISLSVQGIFANSEHFLIVFMLAGVLLLLGNRSWSSRGIFLGGLFLGLAFVIKQHGALFIFGGALFLFWQYLRQRPFTWGRFWGLFSLFILGALTPYLLICVLLAKAGVFANFWYWTFEYARTYTSELSWGAALGSLNRQARAIFLGAPYLWLFALLGVGGAIFYRSLRRSFVIIFTLVSILAVCPGFYFRPHYFILLLPAAALLVGCALAVMVGNLHSEGRKIRLSAAAFLIMGAAISSLYSQRQYLFTMSPEAIVSAVYWPNPFNESEAISSFIEKRSAPRDRIAVIGSEPQIYFYAHRHSASGYIYMYPLMELHDGALAMQKEMIREIEAARPRFLVFVRVSYSWLQKRDSHTLIYKWYQDYKKGYSRIGMVEIPRAYGASPLYSWAPQVRWPPNSPHWIEIMERE